VEGLAEGNVGGTALPDDFAGFEAVAMDLLPKGVAGVAQEAKHSCQASHWSQHKPQTIARARLG
jgi:hypothetical protein